MLEHGALKPKNNGLGFGVGKEPLVSLFASHGCNITATDLEFGKDNQPEMLRELNSYEICEPVEFHKLLTIEYINMNHIPDRYLNHFDFTWPTCAFEHLGSIEQGKQFIIKQMGCLKPGGVSIHTSEYNLSSNEDTIDNGPTVLFRRKDVENLVNSLTNEGHLIQMDYSVGNRPIESRVDYSPYRSSPHIRLKIGQYVSTSFGLIIKKDGIHG